ncbi:MAG: lysophospholipase [Bacilli bacterium]|nr:lysophospholipase [Bacilli bacterium]
MEKDIIFTILGLLIVALFLFSNMVAFGFIACSIIYKKVLTRENGKDGKWSREKCSEIGNPDQEKMWAVGLKFYDDHKDVHTEFSLMSDGFKIVGDYYDFGSDTTVVLVPGRNETGLYSLYFCNPYYELGYNVCVFDPRAHGLSDGENSYCGIGEAHDLRAVCDYVHNVFKSKYVVVHGVCIGGGQATIMMGGENAPDYVKSITIDGIFTTFYEQFRRRMIDGCHPVWPTMWCFRIYVKHKVGVDILKETPIHYLPKVKCPILYLQGKKDIYSLPKNTQKLFDICGSSKKELVWFEEGSHSHLKVTNEEKYCDAIKNFYNAL